MQTDPGFWLGHVLLGRTYEQKGQVIEAIAEYQKAREIDADIPESLMDLGRAYGVAGRKRDAEKVLEEFQERSRKGYVAPFQIAMVYVGLGDKGPGFYLVGEGVSGPFLVHDLAEGSSGVRFTALRSAFSGSLATNAAQPLSLFYMQPRCSLCLSGGCFGK